MQFCGIDESAKVADAVSVEKNVTTDRLTIRKNWRSSRKTSGFPGRGTVLEIVDAAVPEKRGTICVKENGRKACSTGRENELAAGAWSSASARDARTRKKAHSNTLCASSDGNRELSRKRFHLVFKANLVRSRRARISNSEGGD